MEAVMTVVRGGAQIQDVPMESCRVLLTNGEITLVQQNLRRML